MSDPGFGFLIVLIAGWTTDRYGYRIVHYLVGVSVTSIALIVLMATTNLVARYIMFFFVMFMYVFPPLLSVATTSRSCPSLAKVHPDLNDVGMGSTEHCRLEQACSRHWGHLRHGQHRRCNFRADLPSRVGTTIRPRTRGQLRLLRSRLCFWSCHVVELPTRQCPA